jgi:hypothetical protein
MTPTEENNEDESTRRALSDDLRARLTALYEDGRQVADQFRAEASEHGFHPFVAADYRRAEETLLSLRRPGLRFLEWGSATGTITIMADMLGFEAFGIELDPALVAIARASAEKFGSAARFAVGSFLPAGYHWRSFTGDPRLGTIGYGESGYEQLGHTLADFDIIFAYPWGGEEPVMHDLMQRRGGEEALLLLNTTQAVEVYQHGERVR